MFASLPSEPPIRANEYEVKTCGKASLRLRIRIRIHPFHAMHTNQILSCAGAGKRVRLALRAARSR
jgi:hypothetical protein